MFCYAEAHNYVGHLLRLAAVGPIACPYNAVVSLRPKNKEQLRGYGADCGLSSLSLALIALVDFAGSFCPPIH